MTDRRRWRSYGDDPLPTPAQALAAPLSAFPSWFIRMECERCGQERYTNQVHMPAIWHDATVAEVIARMHHEGCGGRPKVVELVTSVAGAVSRRDGSGCWGDAVGIEEMRQLLVTFRDLNTGLPFRMLLRERCRLLPPSCGTLAVDLRIPASRHSHPSVRAVI
jgi:hypothetical protein